VLSGPCAFLDDSRTMGSFSSLRKAQQVTIMLERRIPLIFRFGITLKMNHLD
jgi:hypothetical protein